MADTLANILTQVRDHIDEASAGYWSDAEGNRAIVRAHRRLWAKIIAIRQEWFKAVTPATITLAADTIKYNLATGTSDFFRFASIRTTTSGKEFIRWEPLSQKDPKFIDGLRDDIDVTDPAVIYYDVEGNQYLIVSPIPQGALTAKGEYYQLPTDPAGAVGFGMLDPVLTWIEYEATFLMLAKGPTGDPALWHNLAREVWKDELLPLLGAPRSGQGNDTVVGIFDG